MSGWAVQAVAGLAVGLVLGLAYFGGLVATARRLGSTGSVLVVLVSLLLRLALAGVVLAALARWSPIALGAAVAGLLVVRFLATRESQLDRWFPAPAATGRDPAGSEHG